VALRLEPLADAQLVLGGAKQVGLLLGVLAALGGQIWVWTWAFAYIVETEQDFSLGRISIAIASHEVKSYHVGRWLGFNWPAMDRRQMPNHGWMTTVATQEREDELIYAAELTPRG
jgi:hypothetical protein